MGIRLCSRCKRHLKFCRKSPKAENVGDGMVVDVVHEVEVRGISGVIVVIIITVLFEVGHDGVWDGNRDTKSGSFWSGATNALLGLFHVPF